MLQQKTRREHIVSKFKKEFDIKDGEKIFIILPDMLIGNYSYVGRFEGEKLITDMNQRDISGLMALFINFKDKEDYLDKNPNANVKRYYHFGDQHFFFEGHVIAEEFILLSNQQIYKIDEFYGNHFFSKKDSKRILDHNLFGELPYILEELQDIEDAEEIRRRFV